MHGNSPASQRARLLRHLKHHGRLTTIAARTELDVMHPAARVMELRERGWRIVTRWTVATTPAGNRHRVGEYHLLGGPADARP